MMHTLHARVLSSRPDAPNTHIRVIKYNKTLKNILTSSLQSTCKTYYMLRILTAFSPRKTLFVCRSLFLRSVFP